MPDPGGGDPGGRAGAHWSGCRRWTETGWRLAWFLRVDIVCGRCADEICGGGGGGGGAAAAQLKVACAVVAAGIGGRCEGVAVLNVGRVDVGSNNG